MKTETNKTLKDYLENIERQRDKEYYDALAYMGIMVFTSADKKEVKK
jgi:hypothetical protein